jgi:hypothetical protein
LSISNDTLRHRLASRTGNDYGKDPDDLRDILHWNTAQDELMRGNGAIQVDAEQPVDTVVGDVLRASLA